MRTLAVHRLESAKIVELHRNLLPEVRRFPDHLPKLREQQPKNYINPEFRSSVASGIMPDVEGGILPPGKNGRNIKGRQNYQQPD